jgi:hypothetical protein
MSTRTTYLSKLRRAFLLRIHPDRFRSHPSMQGKQASLVKALANRMNQADFTAWLQQRDTTRTYLPKSNESVNTSYKYVIEKRDGSLLHASISLNLSVAEILDSMANALRKSGAGATIPDPPPEPIKHKRQSTREGISHQPKTWANDMFVASTVASTINTSSNGAVDTRYDIRSNKGRDLKLFLQQNHTDQIRDLRNARIDAISIALQVRRIYQFAAVDATETGWSSTSVAVLLRRLLLLREEFVNQLHVQSFYPIRLVFSPRYIPDDRESALDTYGGILRLNPASTSLQWLETLQYVTPATIEQIHVHRELSVQRTKLIQQRLNIKLSKGFTCSSEDYHLFLQRLSINNESGCNINNDTNGLQASSSSLTIEPLHAVVEADSICRRAVVTNAGIIRLGAGMSKEDCIHSIHRLASSAREQVNAEKIQVTKCNDVISNIKWQLPGLQKVYRIGGNVVSHTEFIDCITRFITVLAQQREDEQQPFIQPFTGNSLGIAPTGQSCQLADDGSVVIPHNWTYA